MTIPVLRGLTEETANLPNLGKSLADLLSGGNSEIQRKLKEAIAQDPSVAESLADLSRNNPELFGALKLGKFGDAIAKTPPGYKQKREEQTLKAGELDIQSKQQDIDLNPVRASILKAQNDRLQLDQKQLDQQAKGFPGVNFKKAVDDFISGQQTPDVQAVMSNPHAMQLFQSMVGWRKQEESLRSQEQRQDARLSQQFDLAAMREDKIQNKKYVDEGTNFFKKYGVGTPQTWAEYLSNPSIQNTVDDLVSGKVLAGKDPHLQALKAIGTRLRQDEDLHTSTTYRQNLLGVDRILKDIKDRKVDKSLGLQQANDLLRQNSELKGTGQIQLTTGDKVPGVSGFSGWFNRNKIVAINPLTGKSVDVGDDINTVDKFAESASPSEFTQQDIQQARIAVKTATPKDLDELKKKHPEMYRILQLSGDIK